MKVIKKFTILLIIVVIVLNICNVAKIFFPLNNSEYITKYSKMYNLDPILVASVIKTESNFKTDAKSRKNAYGLMQITPDTARWAAEKMKLENFSLDMLLNPETNIKMGCWYLSNLKDEFKETDLILAAYNAGRGNVQKWLKDSDHSADGKSLYYIPYGETDKYVKKVNLFYKVYKFLYF